MRFPCGSFVVGICALICWASVSCCAQAQTPPAKKTLTIAADIWCPINCDPAAKKLGIGVDLAKKIFEPLGYEIRYVVMPWTEALSQAKAGKIDALIGASKDEARQLLFPTNAITVVSDDFYVQKGNPWRYQGSYTLKGKRIGIVTDYSYSPIIKSFIDENKTTVGRVQAVSGDDALQQNISRLMEGKIDIVIESKAVMDYTLRMTNMQDKIQWAGGIAQDPVFIAFSSAMPISKERVAQYDAGIKSLRASGALDVLYKSYSLQP